MIVRNLNDLKGSSREILDPKGKWESRRLSLRDDGTGFSMHDTLVYAGKELEMQYKNHYETVYCVSGDGEIEDCETGNIYPVSDGTIYILNGNDKHVLRAFSEMRMVCGFCPPLNGDEVHDEYGSYPAAEDG